MHSPEQVQKVILSFVERQQEKQQEEEKVITLNPMEILYTFMSYFGSWRQTITPSAEVSGEDCKSNYSKADRVDLLSDEDVVNCFVIIMHCIVRDRYMEPVLFTNYIRQSIESIVHISRLQSQRN